VQTQCSRIRRRRKCFITAVLCIRDAWDVVFFRRFRQKPLLVFISTRLAASTSSRSALSSSGTIERTDNGQRWRRFLDGPFATPMTCIYDRLLCARPGRAGRRSAAQQCHGRSPLLVGRSSAQSLEDRDARKFRRPYQAGRYPPARLHTTH